MLKALESSDERVEGRERVNVYMVANIIGKSFWMTSLVVSLISLGNIIFLKHDAEL